GAFGLGDARRRREGSGAGRGTAASNTGFGETGEVAMTAENPFSLAGKVAVVTGGSSGIGAATVRLLAGAGARVVVGYNKGVDRAAALIAELPGSGHQAMYLPLEDSAQIRKVAAAVKEEFGRADILVNSAGFTR